ncbi:hypothetical protein CQA53_02745 [Helicobacter didelphidarum]|uniref:TonB-dependent receptor n=1 Tax=Helicobacter didelphidarum TaxID=2040648 RepID=A0A3D8IN60_9HELI|nr:TonB-dependent receptor [Helicobacter didelphidarum]RDU66708.1 hypothetical protein CQA53_02745 [Helicobacter didelphidarum]
MDTITKNNQNFLLVAQSESRDIITGDSQQDKKESSVKIQQNHYQLKGVVATGSTLQSDVTKIPGNMSVVDSKSIMTMPNTKITDTIKRLPGVRIDNDVSFNPRPKVKIRGINYGTLLMLDGVILSDLEGESRILNQISLYDVERVEVARGSFASLYGTGAIGGVVNFITSMPNKFETTFITGYGNELVKGQGDQNTFKIYGSIGSAFFDKRFKVKLSAGYTRGDMEAGFPTYFANGDNTAQNSGLSGYYVDNAGQTIIGTGGRRKLQTYDIRLKTSYDISENDTISAMLSFSNHYYRFSGYTSFLKDSQGNPTDLICLTDKPYKNYFIGSGLGGIGSYSHLLGNLNYIHDFEDSTLKIAFSTMNLFSWWQDADRDNANNPGTINGGAGKTQDTNSSSNYLDIIYQDNHFDNHRVSAALQFRYYKYAQDQRYMTNWLDKNTRTDSYRNFGNDALVASAYINVDSQWLDSLSTNIGLRYDFWQNFNGYFYNQEALSQNTTNEENRLSVFSPKFGINYKPLSTNTQNLIFKASIGTGFRMPTMRDKYQFTHASNYWDINPNLKHESALSFDIGTEYTLDSKILQGQFTTSLYYFQIELRDMIYREGSGDENNPWKFINAGRGRILGIEYAFSIPLFLEGLTLDGNYTLTRAIVLKNPTKPTTEGKQIPATPLHSFNLSLNFMSHAPSGFYSSLWAFYVPAFYNNDLNSTPLRNTYGYYEDQFSLNLKIGYRFHNGLDISVSFYNMTNYRYYDFYQVAGVSAYAQLGYKF